MQGISIQELTSLLFGHAVWLASIHTSSGLNIPDHLITDVQFNHSAPNPKFYCIITFSETKQLAVSLDGTKKPYPQFLSANSEAAQGYMVRPFFQAQQETYK
jgi:hypothetical protein